MRYTPIKVLATFKFLRLGKGFGIRNVSVIKDHLKRKGGFEPHVLVQGTWHRAHVQCAGGRLNIFQGFFCSIAIAQKSCDGKLAFKASTFDQEFSIYLINFTNKFVLKRGARHKIAKRIFVTLVDGKKSEQPPV